MEKGSRIPMHLLLIGLGITALCLVGSDLLGITVAWIFICCGVVFTISELRDGR